MIITLLVCFVVYVWYVWGDCLKRIPPHVRILIGFALGNAVGLGLHAFASPETVQKVVPYFAPFGALLVSMLKLAVFPIVLFSLIHGAAEIPGRYRGLIGRRTLLWFLGTSVLATVLGLALAVAFSPSVANASAVATPLMNAVAGLSKDVYAHAFGDFLVNLFQNPFAALSAGQYLAILVFAIAVGTSARAIRDAAHPTSRVARSIDTVLSFVDGARRISYRLVGYALHYFPIGIFALTAVNFAETGILLFGPCAKILLSVVFGIAVMMLAVYPLILFLACRENPYRLLLRFREPVLSAFLMRSSIAVLPISFRTMDALAVDRHVAGYALPFGATANMHGVCLHLPVFAVLAANLFGHPLAGADLAVIGVSVILASFGSGGIPGGSVLLLFTVLQSMGLRPDQVAIVVALCLAVNPLLDMFETACNVAGDLVCTYAISRRSGLTLHSEIESVKARILADGRIDFEEAGRLLEIVRPYARLGDTHAVKLEKLLVDARTDGTVDAVESDLLTGLLDLLAERFSKRPKSGSV